MSALSYDKVFITVNGKNICTVELTKDKTSPAYSPDQKWSCAVPASYAKAGQTLIITAKTQTATKTIKVKVAPKSLSVINHGVTYSSDKTKATIKLEVSNPEQLKNVASYFYGAGVFKMSSKIRSIGGCPGIFPSVSFCGGFGDGEAYSDRITYDVENQTAIEWSNEVKVKVCNPSNECKSFTYDIALKPKYTQEELNEILNNGGIDNTKPGNGLGGNNNNF